MALAELEVLTIRTEPNATRKLHLDKYLEDKKGFYFLTEEGKKARPVDLYDGAMVIVSSEFTDYTSSSRNDSRGRSRPRAKQSK